MIRKVIVIAFAVLALWAAPAAAQYGPDGSVSGAGANQGSGGASGGAPAVSDGSLARTGSDVLDLAPYGAALIVVGGLVIVASRRRPADLA